MKFMFSRTIAGVTVNQILLSSLCMLALFLTLTLFLEQQALSPAPESLASPMRQQPPPAQANSADRSNNPSQGWVSTILDRPLFSPTRRPAPGAAASTIAGVGPPRLSGVLISGLQTRAIFAGPAGEKGVVAGEGARVGAYVVQSIGIGVVTLVGPEGTLVVRPTFDAAARSVTEPPAPPPKITLPATELSRRSLLESVRNGPPPTGRPER